MKMNFYERAMLRELLRQSENGIIARSYYQIANEIGGITYASVRNYVLTFVSYGIVAIQYKGTSRQVIHINAKLANKMLNE